MARCYRQPLSVSTVREQVGSDPAFAGMTKPPDDRGTSLSARERVPDRLLHRLHLCPKFRVGVREAGEVHVQFPFREVRRIQHEHACSPDEPARDEGIAFEPAQGTRDR